MLFPLRRTLLMSASLLPLLPALAVAEGKSPQSSLPAAMVQLEPVTVEARQWKEDEHKVPGSVSVLGDDRLGTPLWNDIGAVAKVAPNVQIEQSTVQSRVVMRGMTAANTALQDPVGYFVNDVALPHGVSQAPRIFDLRSMEILKGPQGSLYGRNTEAGAIKVATADPDWAPTAQAEMAPGLKGGADGWVPSVIASGRVSAPLVANTVAASLAVRTENSEGVYQNRFDGAKDGGSVDRWTLSGAVAARAGDDTDVSLKSVVEQSDLGKQRMRFLSGAQSTPRYVTNYNTASWDESLTAVQSAKVVHRFDTLELTAVTGWTHYTRDFQMDLDGGPVQSLRNTLSHEDDSLSQEIRLATADPDARLRWLGGVYGFREWTDLDFSTGTNATHRVTTIDQTGIAAFGQVEIGLTDRLRAGVGSRVEWLGQEGHQVYTTAMSRSAYDGDMDEITVLPRFSLSYDVTPQAMVYGSYARGYLPGGYNYGNATDAATLAYAPEYSWTAELGVKNRFAQDRVGTRLALFHTTTKDKQIFDLIPGGVQKVSNAARARIYGVEFSGDAKLTDRWSTFATGGLQHAEATSYLANVQQGGALVATDLAGNRLPMAATVTYSLGARYDQGDGWFGQASVNGSGPYYFDSQNTTKQETYALVDAEIGYRFDSFEVSLWAANLFDENVYSRAASTMAGVLVEDGDGREIGLRVKAVW